MKKSLLSGLLSVLIGSPALGAWELESDSSLEFVSTKANVAAEVHQFDKLSGGIDTDGMVTVTIDLDSVNTAIEIRDERMRDVLFETAEFPAAVLTAAVDTSMLENLEPGARTLMDIVATLEIRGARTDLSTVVDVARLADDKLLVTSSRPIIVNAPQLGLGAGVEKLREIAGLPSISPAVPVTFSFVFTKTE